MGIRQAVIRYGTLIPDSNNLKSDAILVSVCDTMAAILAGFVVIPTAFAEGMEVLRDRLCCSTLWQVSTVSFRAED
ncbi:MAG: hypothetical protein PUI73_04795 [bacterium]|nr:hypothetical protein [bacterium]MDY5458276.1 hypothetical protein [Bariatricus sp.]